MRAEDLRLLLDLRPFQPFEVRMVDGQRFRLTRIGQFIVGRDDIAVLTKSGTITHFSIGLIATLGPIAPRLEKGRIRMRPEGVRKALYEAEGRPSVVILNSGKRIPIRSREHWMIGDEYLYVLTGSDLNYVSFRNISAIEIRNRQRSRARSG